MENLKRRRRREVEKQFHPNHFAAKENAKHKLRTKRAYNKLEDVNAKGVRYAISPTPELAEDLLRAFHPFLMKYVDLLVTGHKSDVRILTSETKEFLRLFMSGGNWSYTNVLKRLPNMAVQGLMSAEDVYDDLVLIFLEMAGKFNPDIGGFTGYIKRNFKYSVKSRLFEIQKDPLNRQRMHEEEMEDIDAFSISITGEKLEIDMGFSLHRDGIISSKFDVPRLTHTLISSPVPPFDKIWTKKERLILVKYFAEDKPITTIAKELGYCNAQTVKDMFESALSKFRKYIDNPTSKGDTITSKGEDDAS